MTRRRTNVLFAGLTIIAMVGFEALAAGAKPPVPVQVNVERAASPNAVNWRGGEPEIAVNTHNPKNIVVVWAAMQQIKDPGTNSFYPGLVAQFASPGTGMQTIQCGMAYTLDGGLHWASSVWPMNDKPSCGDPMVVADKSGGFEIAFDSMGSDFTTSTEGTQPTDQVALSRSTDSGAHWSTPVNVGSIVDRPFFRIDPATQWLYEVSGSPITLSTPRQLVVSKDYGKTWTQKVNFPSDHLAINHGVIATTLQSGSPATYEFEVSANDGVAFVQSAIRGASTGGSGDWLSADPTHPGRFAVMQQVGDALQVLVTPDSGRTWSAPMNITITGRGVSLPWFDYGPAGDLVVMWKSTDLATSDFYVYASLLRHGSKSFGKPLRISSAASAGPNELMEGAGDDLSWVTVAKNTAYAGWGDRRTGMLQTWFATVPFSDF